MHLNRLTRPFHSSKDIIVEGWRDEPSTEIALRLILSCPCPKRVLTEMVSCKEIFECHDRVLQGILRQSDLLCTNPVTLMPSHALSPADNPNVPCIRGKRVL
jgi:hypothetical protein